MIDIIFESSLFKIMDLFFFNMMIILMLNAVTIKLLFDTIDNEIIPSVLDEFSIFDFVVWSFRILWIIVLIVLNVVVFVDTYNDLYFALANDTIESGTFIKE